MELWRLLSNFCYFGPMGMLAVLLVLGASRGQGGIGILIAHISAKLSCNSFCNGATHTPNLTNTCLLFLCRDRLFLSYILSGKIQQVFGRGFFSKSQCRFSLDVAFWWHFTYCDGTFCQRSIPGLCTNFYDGALKPVCAHQQPITCFPLTEMEAVTEQKYGWIVRFCRYMSGVVGISLCR